MGKFILKTENDISSSLLYHQRSVPFLFRVFPRVKRMNDIVDQVVDLPFRGPHRDRAGVLYEYSWCNDTY